jgi:hypothetical protein
VSARGDSAQSFQPGGEQLDAGLAHRARAEKTLLWLARGKAACLSALSPSAILRAQRSSSVSLLSRAAFAFASSISASRLVPSRDRVRSISGRLEGVSLSWLSEAR